MKILLIGEFSGVHNNLKNGLIALGHDVKLAADGDGYRNFEYDYQVAPYKGRFLGKFMNIFYFLFNFRKFIGFDVIQFINPFSIPYIYHYVGLIHLIFKFNKNKVYYVCGTDPAFLNSEKKFKYFPFDDHNSVEYPNYKLCHTKYCNWLIKHMDMIIPSMYSYYVGYSDNNKTTKPVPLPGNSIIEKNNFSSSNTKLQILFGITRRNVKGAQYILDALERIKTEFHDKVDVKIVEKLDFKSYIRLLKYSDILIDQCKSYDYGMNAINAMENGLIVLSGFEKEAINYLKIKNNPIINIIPDSTQIYSKIKELINLSSFEIQSAKVDSYRYVKKHHDLKVISTKFIDHYLKITNSNNVK